MKRTSAIIFFICSACLSLTSCSSICSCDKKTVEEIKLPIAMPASETLPPADECSFINERISESKQLAKKMNKSRYAVQYLAMSRERVSSLNKRAKEIGCP